MDVRLSILILIAAILLVSGGVAANRAGLPINTPRFLDQVAIHNLFQIRTGGLAANRAEDEALRDFARKMVNNHEQIDEQLRQAIFVSDLEFRLPEALDEAHHVKLTTLDRFEGDSFDRRYLTMIEDSHDSIIRFFQHYQRRGDNEVILNFATETLPQLVEHQQQIKSLKSRLWE